MSKLLALRDKLVDILKNDANIIAITDNIFIQEPHRKLAKTYIVVDPPEYITGIVASQKMKLYADANVTINIYSWKNENAVKLMEYVILAVQKASDELEREGFVFQEDYQDVFERYEDEGNKIMHYAGVRLSFYVAVSEGI